MIKAEIHDCNNVISAEICLRKNHLNIRYAMNGTGKSSIATAIELQSKQGDLSPLKCFEGTAEPICTLSEPIKVLLFNEDFVKNFVFQQSEVIQNSFEVFIKTPKYLEQQNAINARLKKIHVDITEKKELQQLILVGKAVLLKFSLTNGGELQQRGTIKSLVNSESLYKLPKELNRFQPLMQKDYKVEWVGWKNKGAKYDDNGICPFCTSELGKQYETEKKVFTSSYKESDVKNIVELISYFDSVKEFMDEAKRDILYSCVQRMKDENEIQLWLRKFYTELKFLVEEITEVEQFNSYQVRREDIPYLDAQLKKLIIDISNLEIFTSTKVISLISFINEKINSVLAETESLKKDIGELKGYIGTAKEQAIKDINDFLSTAGISYKFDISDKAEGVSRTILSYISRTQNHVEVENINLHLSWGEKNAFALVLFMHFALSQAPQLIILDDPISSFDSNKKYAIISRLFSSKNTRRSFYKKTVLMLTHDLQPVIDYVINEKPTGEFVSAYFLQNNNGMITEQKISESDMMSMPKLLAQNSKNEALNKIHRVACLRKLIEHLPEEDAGQYNAYQLLSCLLHGKNKPTKKDNVTALTKLEIESGELMIQKYINEFEYNACFSEAFTKENLLKIVEKDQNSYYRLQAFRVLVELLNLKTKINSSDNILMKYIDEQVHVENDYMFTLDFAKFDIVPDFVIPRSLEFLKQEGLIK